MQLDAQSQKFLHRMFAEECSPLQDAELAASAIYWARELDGPMKAAAARIRSAHKAVFAPGLLSGHLRERRASSNLHRAIRGLRPRHDDGLSRAGPPLGCR